MTDQESKESKPASTPPSPTKKKRGFAAMDRRRVSQIASKGGRAAHRAGTAHEFTSDEARAAGKKGGPRNRHVHADDTGTDRDDDDPPLASRH